MGFFDIVYGCVHIVLHIISKRIGFLTVSLDQQVTQPCHDLSQLIRIIRTLCCAIQIVVHLARLFKELNYF